MSTFVFARNGMGDYLTGTGMREDMLMQAFNMFLNQAGVFQSTDLAVTETTVPSMAVKVAAGRCFVLNTSYAVNTPNSTRFWGILHEESTVSIATNTSGSTRIDIIIAQIDTGASANDYATNVASITKVQGTPGAGQPATPSDSLLLAVVTIPNGTTTQIVNGDIADSRVRSLWNASLAVVPNNDYLKAYTAAGVLSNLIGINTDNEAIIPRNTLIDGTLLVGGTDAPASGIQFEVRGNIMSTHTQPSFVFVESDAAANNKRWQVSVASEQFYMSAVNDANSAESKFMEVERTANTIDSVRFPGTGVLIHDATSLPNTQTKLYIYDANSAAQILIESLISGTTYGLYMGADNLHPYVGSYSNHDLRLVTNNAEVARFTTDAKLKLKNLSTGNYASIYNDANDDLTLLPNADGDRIIYARHRRVNNDGSVTYQGVDKNQSGWGYIVGNGTPTSGSKTVTFVPAFANTNIRLFVQIVGAKTTAAGDPSNEADVDVGFGDVRAQVAAMTSSQFAVEFKTPVGNTSAAINYIFVWHAIGPTS